MTTNAIRHIVCGALSVIGAGCVGSAAAHPVLELQVALAGASYKATFKISHGCEGSPTRQIVVEVPAGVRGARPMPKAGWALEVAREKLAEPYLSHGRSVTEDVVRVTWTARTPDDQLPNAFYDEFVLATQLPERPGTLYWPVRQVCEQGRHDWTEVPGPGKARKDLRSPAAVLDVLPSGHNAHAH